MLYTEILNTSIDLLELHKQLPQRYPHLLQSCKVKHANNQYDILFANPQASVELWHDGIRTVDEKLLPKGFECKPEDNFLETLKNWYSLEKSDLKSELPFTGGWFTYLSYEFAQSVEKHALNLLVKKDIPIAFLTRFEEALIVERETGQVTLVSEKSNQAAIDEIKNDIADISVSEETTELEISEINEDKALHYVNGVNRIKRYIKEGDIFQVNLSRQWQITLKNKLSPAAIYKRLRQANPAPFSGLMTHSAFAIASSSPERLVSVENGLAETRPIAGTRHRDPDEKKNQALIDELCAHPKEKAEHIMLIDLERNDLGRICQPGTIEVNELMVIESFEHVHHLVSNVIGQLQENVTPDAVIKAVFPGGTITGCPKVRCMQILRELEQTPRSSYTGSMGYINSNGDLDLNILIRGIQIQEEHLTIRAGAGIVADSIAHKEVEETRSKAKGMLAALGIEAQNNHGLLETFRVSVNKSIPLWSYHKARLLEGLKTYSIASENIYKIEKEVFECLAEEGVYRLAVHIIQNNVLNIVITKREDISGLENLSTPAWSTIICETAIEKNSNKNGIKKLDRHYYQHAKVDISQQKVNDAILLSDSGHLIESTMCNLFCIKGDTLYTPLIEDGVEGVMKSYLLNFCEQENIALIEDNIKRDFLLDSDAVFLTNAARGIIPLEKVNSTAFSSEHPLIEKLQQQIKHIFND